MRILGELADGMPREQIASEYKITVEDVVAAIDYAAELVEQEQHHALPVMSVES